MFSLMKIIKLNSFFKMHNQNERSTLTEIWDKFEWLLNMLIREIASSFCKQFCWSQSKKILSIFSLIKKWVECQQVTEWLEAKNWNKTPWRNIKFTDSKMFVTRKKKWDKNTDKKWIFQILQQLLVKEKNECWKVSLFDSLQYPPPKSN